MTDANEKNRDSSVAARIAAQLRDAIVFGGFLARLSADALAVDAIAGFLQLALQLVPALQLAGFLGTGGKLVGQLDGFTGFAGLQVHASAQQ